MPAEFFFRYFYSVPQPKFYPCFEMPLMVIDNHTIHIENKHHARFCLCYIKITADKINESVDNEPAEIKRSQQV
jgi:hypothetical protein